jgi:ubiquinone/menaquinone biosynthesis C-methylase UbiE
MYFLYPILRIFFQLLYHQFAWTYDWVAGLVSLGLWKEWVRGVVPYLDGSAILELGHGPGHLQLALQKKGLTPFGLDASPQMGRLARRRLKRNSLPSQIVRAAAQSIPVANGSFDQVVATFPTEYITAPETLSEIWRVLQPGGRVVVLPAAWITGQGWMERYAAGLFRITKQSPRLPQSPGLPGSEGFQVDFPLIEQLRNAGFQVQVEWKTLRSSTLILILGEKATQAYPVYED